MAGGGVMANFLDRNGHFDDIDALYHCVRYGHTGEFIYRLTPFNTAGCSDW